MPNYTDIQSIRNFKGLIRYLRTELNWPVDEEQADDLTFDYEPEELGLDPKHKVKVREIKQIRPLVNGQPWGIFWIDFEPKRLPISVMRRILNQLVTKKRGGKIKQATWRLDELLFISAIGDPKTEQRGINFAHFHHETGELPTLRVLGWDGADTVLKIDYVVETLKDKLRWPVNPKDIGNWREKWASAFRHKPGHVIRKADALAERLAGLARSIRAAAETLLEHEAENGRLRRLYKAFQTALIHDLTEADFADTYAQTITYGLLTAAISRTEMSAGQYGTALVAENVTDMVPITNPFLREMLQTFLHAGGSRGGIDFDELGIQDVVELLRGDETDLPAILRDFGNRTQGEDPVIHFYEHFLNAYNKQLKIQRGVFYTPQPIVSNIVRSVHELLQTEFGLKDGLASTVTWGEMTRLKPGLKIPNGVPLDSPFVNILDPATGTATFLVEVIDVIHDTLINQWKQQRLSTEQQSVAWNNYVPKHLLPRLYGYELMMAPYAIAHMKIGLKLYETGYRFRSDERVRVFLTNALEPASDDRQLAIVEWAPALAHEAKAVNNIKRHQYFTVVIGNPPYSKASQNLGDVFEELIERFRYFREERIREPGAILFERDINNDYCKFLGFSRLVIEASQVGVLGLITSSSYLDGKNFRGVRDALLSTFNKIFLLDLHGDSRSGSLARKGVRDENVFEIETGVCITVLVKTPRGEACNQISYANTIGTYAEKCTTLLNGMSQLASTIVPIDVRRYCSFLPSISSMLDEYSKFPRLDQFFGVAVDGIKTSRDGLVIANSASDCASKIKAFMTSKQSEKGIEEQFGISVANWDYKAAQQHLRKSFSEEHVHRLAYRPLDFRYIYYDRELVFSHRQEKMIHMIRGKNKALVCASRLSANGFDNILPADCLVEMKYASHDTNSRVFPFHLFDDSLFGKTEDSNLSSTATAELRSLGSNVEAWSELINAIFALLNSSIYRTRYYEEIKNDFPALPLLSKTDVRRVFAELGRGLIQVQLLQVDVPVNVFKFQGKLGQAITTPALIGKQLHLTESSFFEDVDPKIYAFQLAGYQVCKSWVTAGSKSGIQRKGQLLTSEDVNSFRRLLFAIAETIRIRHTINIETSRAFGW